MEIVDLIVNSQYTYPLVFLGIMLGGEVVLVPAVYLALIGTLDTPTLFAITVVATLISDSVWYFIGMLVPNKRLGKLPIIKRRQAFIDRFSEFFGNNGLKLLFYSKFVYGTRIITQLLFGIYRRNFFVYSLVNVVGVLAWAVFIFVVGAFISYSLESLKDIVFGTQIVFAIFVLALIIIHVVIQRLAKRKWHINGGKSVPQAGDTDEAVLPETQPRNPQNS